MSTWSLFLFRIGSMLGLLVGAGSPALTAAQAATDPEGPLRLVVDRDGSRLTVRGLYVQANAERIELTYELTVDREGAVTSRTQQTGAFIPNGGHPDTLSITRINVEPGDQLSLRLVLRQGRRVVDTVCRDEVVSSVE